MSKIRVTSPDHVYVNEHLIDMNLIKHWFETQSWPSHSPRYAVTNLAQFIIGLHTNGFGEFTTEIYALDKIQSWLQSLDYYGYRIDDVCFAGGSIKYYRLIPGTEDCGKGDPRFNTKDEHYVVPENWWKAKDPVRFPRIEL